MPKRETYHITHSDGDWQVKKIGIDRASGKFDNKAYAVDFRREKAKNKNLGQLLFPKKNGTIQEERTYGKDPYLPKG